ncbi:MAG TPA: glycoside hydrolase family 38 C-terminal domain-containing protein [Mycobacteriales bacterium]|nr:glycoside hydrolase family 38 C-terminal domain-containing protein [Mycobacteriales bacterium]
MNQRHLHMIGNAHLDPVWLWQWQEGYQEARATLWSAVERLDEYPDFVFTLDQIVLLDWIRESDPELFARVGERIKDGRMEVVGGWWVEPDCNIPHGESFVRQGLLGQRFLKHHFGVMATVGCNEDPFGHNVMLPQILAKQGMHAYCFLRPGPHERELPSTAFWWESPDGSRVLAYRIAHEYCGPRGDVSYHVEKALNQTSPDVEDAMVFYGVGNHGGGPTRENMDSIKRLNELGTFGRLEPSTPSRYFAQLLAERGDEIPVWRNDLQLHAVGCYSAHSGIKRWNRQAEQELLAAERFAVIARNSAQLAYPAESLTHAWKQVLFNQFHDILPGSAIEAAYDDARDQIGEAKSVAGRVINLSLQSIARQVAIPLAPETQPVLAFNPHPWPVTTDIETELAFPGGEVHVTDDSGTVVPSQPTRPRATVSDTTRRRVVSRTTLPALGYRLLTIRSGAEPVPSELQAEDNRLENSLVRLRIDPRTGWLSEFLDKRTGVDLVQGISRPHTVVSEDASDTWGHRVLSYVAKGRPFRPRSVRLIESGPVRAVIRVESEFGRSTLREEFILRNGSATVEVRVRLDWHEQLHLLKLRFPTALTDAEVTYEVPFGHLARPADSGEKPGQSWVDLTGRIGDVPAGLTVINNAKHAYDATAFAGGVDLGITAARGPVYAWHDPRQLEADGAFSYQDQGVQEFGYLLVPHAGDREAADVVRTTAQFLMPARSMMESFHDGPLAPSASFLDGGAGSVVITAVKAAEDASADTIVRAVESAGHPASARIDVLDRSIEADFGAHEIKTFRVPAAADQPVVETDLLEFDLP